MAEAAGTRGGKLQGGRNIKPSKDDDDDAEDEQEGGGTM